MSCAPVPTFWMEGVIPSTTVYSAGTGSFKVPKYNRFVIKLWGAGGSSAGSGWFSGSTYRANCNLGTSGGPSYAKLAGSFSMQANGGGAGNFYTAASGTKNGTRAGGLGGTVSGGNTINKSGSVGGAIFSSPPGTGPGYGGNGAYGGLGGTVLQGGGAPGGGAGGRNGSGYANNPLILTAGGGGGGYSYSLFAPGVSGAPVFGSNILWGVGAAGVGGAGYGTHGVVVGLNGGVGKVAFVVS